MTIFKNIKNKTLFVRWWLLLIVSIISSLIAYGFGVFHDVYKLDSTMLSEVIYLMYIYMTIWCGIKTWKLSRMEESVIDKKELDKVIRQQEVGWFTSDLCLTLGMIGTVIGFIMMLDGFTKVDAGNTAAIQKLIATMGSGMATALYTTLVGLVCGMMLKIQYMNIAQGLDALNSDENAKKL